MVKMRSSSTVRPGCFVSLTFVGLSIPVVKVGYISVNRFIIEQLRQFPYAKFAIVIFHYIINGIMLAIIFLDIHNIKQ